MPRKTNSKRDLAPIQRLGIALGHPLRIRILSALVAGEGSATSLSHQFGDVSVGDVFYHLGVLADDCELLECVRSRRVRGAFENFFRLRPGPSLGPLQLPDAIAEGLRGELFRTFVDAAVVALDTGSLDAGEAATFAARPVTVDRRGLAEINAVLVEAMERISGAEAEARRRLNGAGESSEAIGAVVGTAAFRAAMVPGTQGEPAEAA